jgi:hypothetical protein
MANVPDANEAPVRPVPEVGQSGKGNGRVEAGQDQRALAAVAVPDLPRAALEEALGAVLLAVVLLAAVLLAVVLLAVVLLAVVLLAHPVTGRAGRVIAGRAPARAIVVPLAAVR